MGACVLSAAVSRRRSEILNQFDLVIADLAEPCCLQQGINRTRLVHQGVDTVFNAEPVPRLVKRSLVIFLVGNRTS